VPNVKLVLLDPDTDQPVARTTTDANGEFTFPDLPVGEYTPVVVGPWEVVRTRSGPLFEAVRGAQHPQLVTVVPGPEVEDPDTASPGPADPGGVGTPPPAGGSGPIGDGARRNAETVRSGGARCRGNHTAPRLTQC
jgi:hypothetical protein